jgi:hypothetical protein
VLHNLSWAAEGHGVLAEAEHETSLGVGTFPRAKLRALRKRFPTLEGFFLGEEGQDTLAPGEDIEYMPSECNCWIMGIFDEAITRVEDELSEDEDFARCKLQLMGHDGTAPLRLQDHLKSVRALRRQHGYTPEPDFIVSFLRVWTNDDQKVQRWLRSNPSSPKMASTTKTTRAASKSGGLRSSDVLKLRAALSDLWASLHVDPGKALEKAIIARVSALASEAQDEIVRQNALYVLGRTRPFTPRLRKIAIQATNAKQAAVRVAGMNALAESGDEAAKAAFLDRLPRLSSSDGFLVAQSGLTDPRLIEMVERLRAK